MNQTIQKTDPKILDQILDKLKKGKTFLLSGHQNPDADVIGSALAMRSLLLQLGSDKKIAIQNSGKPPKGLTYLPGIEHVESVEKVQGKYDVIIVLECSGMDRMGNIVDFKTQATDVINIDHHLHNPNFGTVNFVEPTTSSTSEMIFKLFERSKCKLDRNSAICLYTGLVADTGWFRYGNTNSQTHEIASKLLPYGVPVSDMAENLYMSRSPASMKLLGWVLTNRSVHFNNQVSLIKIPLSVFNAAGATGDDLEEVVNFGLMQKSVLASALLKEKEGDVVKVSLRSKGEWDINQVARKFDGGGHKNASGCAIEESLDKAADKILNELKKIFEPNS